MSTEYIIEGTVIETFDTKTFDKGFTKRDIVIETDDKYPQQVKLEFVKDNIALIENLSEGANIKVKFSVRGNEYNGNYYVNLQGYKVAILEQSVEEIESKGEDKEMPF